MKTYLLFAVLAQWSVGEDVPRYEAPENVSGTLVTAGADAMSPLMAQWAREFAARHPDVKLKRAGPDAVTASDSAIDGAIRVAMDAVAVFVHKDNPLDEISLDELEAVYSGERRHRIETWGGLGLKGDWTDRQIVVWRRPPDHPHCEFFKERVLRRTGAFHEQVSDDDAGIVHTVAIEPAGIGFAAVGLGTSEVKMLRVSARKGDRAHDPEGTAQGAYPLGRYLYVQVDKAPLAAEFARFALSREGQFAVMTHGWLPLPAAVIEEERAKLD